MLETSSESASSEVVSGGMAEDTPFVPGVCNAFNVKGKPCVANAMPGGLRCIAHRDTETYPRSYALPPAVAAPAPADPTAHIRNAIDRAAAEAAELDDPANLRIGATYTPVPDDSDFDDDLDEPLFDYAATGLPPSLAAASRAAQVKGTNTPDDEEVIPPGFEKRHVYDGDADDYVLKIVPIETAAAPVRVLGPDTYHDEFELGDAYRNGENAAFDYRWIHEDPRMNLTDRKNGFVPVKKALDSRFRVEGGVVKFGDLVLARRPKHLTEQRAMEMARSHEKLVGEVSEYAHLSDGQKGFQNFATVTGDRDYELDTDRERVQQARQRQAEAREQQASRSRGRRSYAIPAMPWQRDLVAERHGSVGG